MKPPSRLSSTRPKPRSTQSKRPRRRRRKQTRFEFHFHHGLGRSQRSRPSCFGQMAISPSVFSLVKETKLLAVGLRIDSVRANRRRFVDNDCTWAKSLPMRISRGNQVIGKWSAAEIKERLGREDLLLTDLF